MRAPLIHPMLSHYGHCFLAGRDSDGGDGERGVVSEAGTCGVAAAGAVADIGRGGWGGDFEGDGGAVAGCC